MISDRFPASDRFTLVRRVGAGGMGVVYEAIDRLRGLNVAVKTLPDLDARALLRFKDEFRTLADVAHPNLATLHELIAEDGRWFFTMELVSGVSFLDYVRPPTSPGAPDSNQGETRLAVETTVLDEGSSSTGVREAVPTRGGVLDIARLRHVLPQIAAGLSALHAAGKLHCDIKPSNILVTREGRSVILDFGVARSLESAASTTYGISGTVAYMAPEQAAGQALGPAADSYALGVMLWESAVGRVPFTGTTNEILREKQHRSPPPLVDVAPGIPEDLAVLCARLLERSPERRLVAADLLAQLTGETPTATVRVGRDLIVGRDQHLRALAEAFQSVKAGRPVTLLVRGASGMGKSTLIAQFLADVARPNDAVVLSGRCYENESVPYKAVDSVVDQLGRHLAELGDPHAWLPRDAHLLAQLFPVLAPVVGTAAARGDEDGAPADAQVVRRRAFAAFRALMTALALRRPLVLHVDDLHWGDTDSALLLSYLLRAPDAPCLLFLASFRGDEAEASDCVRALRQEEGFARAPVLELDALDASDARRLAETLLAEAGRPSDRAVEIASEAHGNPYFIHELVERSLHVSLATTEADGGRLTLDGALRDRVDGLSPDTRRLLEVVAVSGRPVFDRDAFVAARLSRDPGTLITLRKLRFVRTTGSSDRLLVDTYHDRIRETLIGRMPADDVRQHHRQLALALAASGEADDETLGRHWQGAGEPTLSARHYVRAADAATVTLTFEHAAQLYRRALEAGLSEDGRHAVRVKLADALANAGRCHEAALIYEEAARPTGDADLQERAANLYCLSGHPDEGRALFKRLFQAAGLTLPASPSEAVRMLVWDRVVLGVTGLSPRSRPSAGADGRRAEARIDLLWAATTGLMEFDPITGGALQGRGLRLALRHGEPSRIARALAVAAMFLAYQGTSSRPRFNVLIKHARDRALGVDHPPTRAVIAIAEGLAYWLIDRRWDAAAQVFDEAEAILRREPVARTWEMAAVHSNRIWMHYFRGELRTSVDYSLEVIRDARERGNLYQSVNLGILAGGYIGLMADDPEDARSRMAAAAAALPQKLTSIQHIMLRYMDLLVSVYAGEPEAWNIFAERWPEFVATHQLRIEQMRIQMYHLRARCAMTSLPTAARPAPLVREAERMAAKLAKEVAPWAKAESQTILAGLAAWQGDRTRAVALLDEAARTLEALGLAQSAVPTRRQQGVLLGGDRGRAMVEAADQALARHGVRAPDKWARMWVSIPQPSSTSQK